MKILFLIRALTFGGAERQLSILSRELAARGHSVYVAVYYRGGALENDVGPSVEIIDLRKSSRYQLWSFLARLRAVIASISPDVIYSFLPSSNALSALAKPKASSACLVFGIRGSLMRERNYDLVSRLLYKAERYSIGRAALLVANSHAGCRDYKRIAHKSRRCVVIPNGIDTLRFQRDAALGLHWRQQNNLGEHDAVVGIIGRIEPMKGHRTLLQAIAQLNNAVAKITFVIIGEGVPDYVGVCRQLAHDLGISHRLKWLSPYLDLRPVYSGLDLLCLPSTYGEGFPNVVGEAMSCGVPCVVTDVGDSARVVGDTGWIVAPENPRNLAQTLQEALMDNELEHRSMRARERIQNLFSVERMVVTTEKELLGVVNELAPA